MKLSGLNKKIVKDWNLFVRPGRVWFASFVRNHEYLLYSFSVSSKSIMQFVGVTLNMKIVIQDLTKCVDGIGCYLQQIL